MTSQAEYLGRARYFAVTGSIVLNHRLARVYSLGASSPADAVLPDATRLRPGGPYFRILNLGPSAITLKDNTGATAGTIANGSMAKVYLETGGTQAGVWRAHVKALGSSFATGVPARKLYVVGGNGSETTVTVYTIAPTDAWAAGTAAPNQKREGAHMHLGGRANFVGYYPATGGISNKNDELTEAGAWVARPDCPFNPARTCGVGFDAGGLIYGGDAVTNVAAFIPFSTWVSISGMPIKKSRCTAVSIRGLGKAIIIAGDPVPSPNLAHNPTNDTFWTIANLPSPFRHTISSFAIDHRVYACGGRSESPVTRYSNVDEYDVLTDAWAAKAPLSMGIRYGGAGVGSNARGYFCGGLDNADAASALAATYHSDSWAGIANMPAPRSQVANTGVGL